MRAVVTGAAGFIGSHVTDFLLADGHEVIGVDCFSDYYEPSRKHRNLQQAAAHPGFSLREDDVVTADLSAVCAGADVIFHLAAQPGVRGSWRDGFRLYADVNILGTQRLLETAQTLGVARFVYASSSSVYGNALRYPTSETDVPKPYSPYGVTKLAAEHLCGAYADNGGVSVASLRYFTVYGPRQRPEMAMHRLIDAALLGGSFPLYGTGSQVRDFTYVTDVARATVMAGLAETIPSGAVMNVAGGSPVTMNEVIAMVEELSGRPISVDRSGSQPGDVERTGGETSVIERLLGWNAQVSLREGLAAQLDWQREDRAAGGSPLR